MKALYLLSIVLILQGVMAVSENKHHKSNFLSNLAKAQKSNSVALQSIDMCPFCASYLGNNLDILVDALLDGGVVAGCAEACERVTDEGWAVTACEMLCDYVGIDLFTHLLEIEDPDPIYVCQVWRFCQHSEGGKVNITKAYVYPPQGQQGTVFKLVMEYEVVRNTSVGSLMYLVIPPFGQARSEWKFVDAQTPGRYSVQWQLGTDPVGIEPYAAGTYTVQFAVCAGHCDSKHEWSGVYAERDVHFKIVQSLN